MSSLKALFIPTLNSGCVYWRMFGPVTAALRNKEFYAHLLWWQKNLNENHPWQNDVNSNQHRARILGEIESGVRQADVVIMGMIHTMSGLITMQGIRECYGKPVIVEADDNVLSCPTYNPASKFYNPDSPLRKLAVSQLREADAVVVTTPHLKEVYSEFNDNIYIIPNSIDFDLWGKTKKGKNKGKIAIGWVGGATHNDDLSIIAPAIKYITNKFPQVEFVFGHGMHPEFKGMKNVRWMSEFVRIDKYPKAIAKMGFDIGLAPIVDNSFNRSKSNLRWLEYSALKIPTIASSVGHFKDTINHGVDGFLADGPNDFIRYIEELVTDTAKRKEMARNAYSRVFQDFNVDNTIKAYKSALEEVIGRGQIKRTVPVYKDSNFKQEVEVFNE